jgi:hypothetical protein
MDTKWAGQLFADYVQVKGVSLLHNAELKLCENFTRESITLRRWRGSPIRVCRRRPPPPTCFIARTLTIQHRESLR